MRFIGSFLALCLVVYSSEAFAFPELIRHHYVNCNSCHLNPNGGGLLNEYGRGMASEVLSTWSYENESLLMHGAIKPDKMPKWLNVGGDIRGVQTHRETRRVREGKYILMQTSLELGLTAGPVTAVGSYFKPDRQNHVGNGFSRFYGLGQLSETLQLKAGRFLPAFGINDPHHVNSTRQPLGFGYESERNAAELHYSGEQWHLAAGVSKSRLDSALRQEEEAVHLQAERFFADKYRAGFSVWNGKSALQKRWLASFHGMLGFSENLFFLGELAHQQRRQSTPAATMERGIFQSGRLGYELFKGFHLLALEDFSKSNLSVANTMTFQVGPGVLWYPRPHLEFEFIFAQRKALVTSNEFEDYAYLMFHYYL